MNLPESEEIQTLEQLESLFGEVGAPSLQKEVNFLHPVYQRWIQASPFLVLATRGPGGLDASPRGDPAGLVHVQDARTLLLPERRGNNRIDSLRNILHHPQVGLLFLVPGVNETLRVNGTARILAGPELLERFALQARPPKCILEITVETAFFQCGRAMIRSGLWQQNEPASVPTAGEMLQAVTGGVIKGQEYDVALPARQKETLY
ncbi:pyridoxamine 5'-phosphate oxidase family protein [Deinococcus antarcticus]|uniref:Pyridoxamine 5'-phosphate oxidase family protein n=1 Tax=Deinococcus antarcticus TaxID=1298767 RepID=A0ABV8AC39_9DEIO